MTPPLRILQLNLERGWRGGERQTLLSLRLMRERGHDAALLARRGGELAARARAAGIPVFEASGLAGMVWVLLRQGRRYDALHAQTAQAMSALALLRFWLGPRLVFTRRTAFPLAHGAGRTAWKWRQADIMVAISEAAAAAPRQLGLAPRIIPSAVEPTAADPARLQAFLQTHRLSGRRIVATVAALSPEKDPLTLLRMAHTLRQQRSDFVLLHLGADGAAGDAARQLVHTLGLEDFVIFAGFQTQVEALYPLMDVFVLSSQQEALGSSVLDAFLAEVPVAATQAGGLPELLADGRGLLSPVGDAPALAAQVSRLLDDNHLRHTVTARALAYVQREHEPSVMVSRYLELYAGLAQSGRDTRVAPD